jgi:adenosylcobinamide-GDP ribazoletransferase
MRDALALLTTFGRAGSLNSRATRWFPVVGALLGAVVGAVWRFSGEWWPVAVAAVLAVGADLACTGLLHVDGLADASDGLLPHASRERRLAIMRAPDVGAFGVAVVGFVLVARVVAFASQPGDVLLVVALWAAARSFVAAVPAWVPYVREHGMASAMAARPSALPALAIAPCAVMGGIAAGGLGVLAVVGGVAAGGAVIALARRRIGGFTGDVLGAAIVIVETAGLLIAAAQS